MRRRLLLLPIIFMACWCAILFGQTYERDGEGTFSGDGTFGQGSFLPSFGSGGYVYASVNVAFETDDPVITVNSMQDTNHWVRVDAEYIDGGGGGSNQARTIVHADTAAASASMYAFSVDLDSCSGAWSAYEGDTLQVWLRYESGLVYSNKFAIPALVDTLPPTIDSYMIATWDSAGAGTTLRAVVSAELEYPALLRARSANGYAGLISADWETLSSNWSSQSDFHNTGLSPYDGVLYVQISAVNSYGNQSTDVDNISITRQAVGTPGLNNYAVHSGEYYWLPDDAVAADYSGYENQGYISTEDEAVVMKIYSWSDFEDVTPGSYDWSELDTQFGLAASNSKRIALRILSAQRHAGDDPMERIPSCYHSYLSEIQLPSNPGYPTFVANVWQPTVAAAFNAFVDTLGARYADSEYLESIVIHGISNAAGEEFILEPASDLAALSTEWGADADTMQAWLQGRMDAFAEGFDGYEYKVVWVGSDTDIWDLYMPSAWKDANDELLLYAWAKGFGNRSGIVEYLTIDLYNDAFGMGVDSLGYQTTDDVLPHIERRYLGDENEEYGAAWTDKFGDDNYSAHRFRITTFEALRRKVSHLWTTDAANDLDTTLHDYVLLQLGNTIETTPDIWCYLRETDIGTGYVDAGAVKNIERWLTQRDLAGGMTVATEFVARDFDSGWNVAPYGDFTARRTDTANGSDRIFFNVDSRFDLSDTLHVMVEVVDSLANLWSIEYFDDGDTLTTTDIYAGPGDDSVRTIDFTLASITPDSMTGGTDFAIKRESGGDVVARWVRVVRKVPDVDATAPTWDAFAATDYDSSGSGGALSVDLGIEVSEEATVRVRSASSVIGVFDADWDTVGTAVTDTSYSHDTGISPFDGRVYVLGTVIDTAGNMRSKLTEIAVGAGVDTVAPTINTFIVSAPDSTGLDGDWTVNLEFDSDEAGTAVAQFATSFLGLAGADTSVLGAGISSYDGVRNTGIAVTDLGDGDVWAKLTVTDASSNESSDTDTVGVARLDPTLDTDPPIIDDFVYSDADTSGSDIVFNYDLDILDIGDVGGQLAFGWSLFGDNGNPFNYIHAAANTLSITSTSDTYTLTSTKKVADIASVLPDTLRVEVAVSDSLGNWSAPLYLRTYVERRYPVPPDWLYMSDVVFDTTSIVADTVHAIVEMHIDQAGRAWYQWRGAYDDPWLYWNEDYSLDFDTSPKDTINTHLAAGAIDSFQVRARFVNAYGDTSIWGTRLDTIFIREDNTAPVLASASILWDEATETITHNVTSGEAYNITFRDSSTGGSWDSWSAYPDTYSTDQNVVIPTSAFDNLDWVYSEVAGKDTAGNVSSSVTDSVQLERGPLFSYYSYVAFDTTTVADTVSIWVVATLDSAGAGWFQWKAQAADPWLYWNEDYSSTTGDETPMDTLNTHLDAATMDSAYIRGRYVDADGDTSLWSTPIDTAFTRAVPSSDPPDFNWFADVVFDTTAIVADTVSVIVEASVDEAAKAWYQWRAAYDDPWLYWNESYSYEEDTAPADTINTHLATDALDSFYVRGRFVDADDDTSTWSASLDTVFTRAAGGTTPKLYIIVNSGFGTSWDEGDEEILLENDNGADADTFSWRNQNVSFIGDIELITAGTYVDGDLTPNNADSLTHGIDCYARATGTRLPLEPGDEEDFIMYFSGIDSIPGAATVDSAVFCARMQNNSAAGDSIIFYAVDDADIRTGVIGGDFSYHYQDVTGTTVWPTHLSQFGDSDFVWDIQYSDAELPANTYQYFGVTNCVTEWADNAATNAGFWISLVRASYGNFEFFNQSDTARRPFVLVFVQE